MKKIIKTTERNWQCPYCNFLNDLSDNRCKSCGAVRNGNEVEKEITTNFEETTVTETPDVSEHIVISNSHSIGAIFAFATAIFAIVALIFSALNLNTTNNNSTNCTVISKDWEYTISIGEYIMQTGITSYVKPPADAENVTTKQVMQDNGWYKTEYVYNYPSWQITRTEKITGTNNAPTFKEYSALSENEKIIETSKVRYSVTIQTYLGTEKISIPESKWKSITEGNVYSLDELK